LTYKGALCVVAEGIPIKIVVPRSVGHLSSRVRKIHEAFDELERYMLEMMESHRDIAARDQRSDLLSRLMDANETGNDGTDEAKLTDPEIIGNIFIFLLAGHESTAHTLCFALALLALYPDEQERVYRDILKAIPGDRDPVAQDLVALNYILCVLNETLRMFPPVVAIPKEAAEDCTLVMTGNAGEQVTVAVPKGSTVSINIVGLHYNPKYWEDPLSFKPSRFEGGKWPRDAFIPFSSGPRSCLGRRFSEAEFVVVIAMLVKKYKIAVKEEPQFFGETYEERKERVLRVKSGLTLTPLRMPLVFVRRD